MGQESIAPRAGSRIHAVIESIDVGLLLERADGRIGYVNQPFLNLFGIPGTPDGLVGGVCRDHAARAAELFVGDTHAFLERIRTIIENGQPVRHELLGLRDGRTFARDYAPPPGGRIGGTWMYRDVTHQVRATEAIERSDAMKTAMLEASLDAIVAMDARGAVVDYNPAAEDMFGYRRSDVLGRRLGDLMIPPGQRECHRRELAALVAGRQTNLLGRRVEVEGMRANGDIFPMELCLARTESAGAPLFVGYLRDLTDVKAKEATLRDLNETLALQLRELGDFRDELLALNELSSFLQTCARLEDVLAVAKRFLSHWFPHAQIRLYLGKGSQGLESSFVTHADEEAGQTLRPEDCWALRRSQAHVVTESGSSPLCPHVEHRYSVCLPVPAASGQLALICLVSADDSTASFEVARAERILPSVAERIGFSLKTLSFQDSLREQSLRDGLTQLYNRRFFDTALTAAVAAARAAASPLALLLVDIDHFKRINDTHGHQVGDAALQAVAQRLLLALREGDTLCRVGGEEFAVLMPGAELKQAERRAEQLRAGAAVHISRFPEPVTVSVGVACLDEGSASGADGLLRAADEALYEAKRLGRNRVSTGHQGPDGGAPSAELPPARTRAPGNVSAQHAGSPTAAALPSRGGLELQRK